MALTIGFLIFPRMTQLDFTGPFEVFSRLPGAEVHVVAKSLDPVVADTGLRILPSCTLADCPALDVICVPGGPFVDEWYDDQDMLGFLRAKAETAQFVTSVCTGSLILGAAGLLRGYKATTHWTSLDLLASFGAMPTKGRVVRDRNRLTGGGVTAGIDFALTLAAELSGARTAKMIQLSMEYDPAPPFDSGHPDRAEPEVTEALKSLMAERMARRRVRTLAAAG